MSSSPTNGELKGLLEELAVIAGEARREFGTLSPSQLNWKPSPEQWSVGQCFEHLIKTNAGFFPVLERIGGGEYSSSAWERWSPFSGLFGRMLLRSLEPDSGKRLKAPPGIRPSSSDVGASIVEEFARSQTRLSELMSRTAGRDLKKLVVTSPVSGFVTYSLLDAFRIVVVHERRHLAQARRVTQAEGFPS